MSKKRKTILVVIGGAVLLLLLVNVILEAPYRNHLPALPDLQVLSPSLQEQITAASKKAYRNPSVKNLGMLGMVYHSSANYGKAAECYKLAIQKDKSEWIWNYYLGYLNREMGESNSAIENFNAVIAKNPKIYQASYYIGEEFQNAGNNGEAVKAFGRIINVQNKISAKKSETRYDYFPLSTYANFQISRIYLELNQVDLAEKTLKDIIKNYRSFGPAYRLLSNVYQIKGDSVLSNRYMLRSSDMAVYSSPIDTLVDRLVLLSRSELYILKQIDEAQKSVYPEWALKLVDNAMQYLPENKYLISKAVHLFVMMDKGQKAIPYTDQHIRDYQDDYNEMKSVGDLYYQKGFYSQAEIYYNKAENLKPEDADVQFCLILSLWKQGNKQKALGRFNELIEKNSKNTKILTDGVSMLLLLGEKEKAIAFLPKLRELSPSNPKVQKIAGSIAQSEGRLDEAVNLYEASLRSEPEDLTTIRSLGNILMKQDKPDKLINLYKKALEYHPNDAYLLERLGTILVSCPDPKLRNIKEGMEYSERAFINTNSHSITLISAGRSLAIGYAMLGDKKNAYRIMSMTINVAKQENIPESYLAELNKMLMQFR